MKKIIAFLAMMVSLFLLSLGANLAQEQPLKFNRPEVESLMNFFNETNIRGADIETWATLAQKLKMGVKEASVFVDTGHSVAVPLTSSEAKICIDIIDNATFQAKRVDMVYSMKRKLHKVAPGEKGMRPR